MHAKFEMNTVQYLLHNQSRLTHDEKLKIKKLGRPMPDMKIENVSTTGSRSFRRSFKYKSYNRYPWMCGCDVIKAMFCFPCLLFGKDHVWTKAGSTDLKHMSERATKHAVSRTHLNSELEMVMLGGVDLRKQLDSSYTASLMRHRESVDKNRFLLSKIVECVRYCGAYDLPSGRSLSELLNATSSLNESIHKHLRDAAVFKGTSKAIQDALLDAMLAVYRDVVIEEVASASFLAVQADDIGSYTMLTVRYEMEGEIVERFWGFFNTDVDGLSNVILRELENANVTTTPEKLVSQSYDGSAVMIGPSGGRVHDEVKTVYREANYVHSYAHRFNEVVRQSTSKRNKTVATFFSRVDAFYTFFSESSKRADALNRVLTTQGETVLPRWNSPRDTVNTLFIYKDEIAQYLEDVCDGDYHGVRTLNKYLYDPDFTHWLSFFCIVFLHVNKLFRQFQRVQACDFQVQLQESVVLFKEKMSKLVKLGSVTGTETVGKRSRLVTRGAATREVCEVITTQLEARLQFTGHIVASQLLDPDKFAAYSAVFPEKALGTTADAFPSLRKSKLRAELEVLYSRNDMHGVDGLTSMLQLFISNNLMSTFSETVTLCRVLGTVPMPTTETRRRFRTLSRARAFLRHAGGLEGVCALGVLSLEREFVNAMPHFNRLVVEKFARAGSGRGDFLYR